MRFVLPILLILGQVFAAFAEVKISKQDQIVNFGPGYCSWCCLETLGRHHEVKRLYKLAENRSKEPEKVAVDYGTYISSESRNGGGDRAVYNKLKALGVKFEMQWTGNKNTDLIEYAIKNNLACEIVVNAGGFGTKGYHSIILTEFTDKGIKLVDPNDPGAVYTASRAWFDYWWTGRVVVIMPE
jgi:hypothetical protein